MFLKRCVPDPFLEEAKQNKHWEHPLSVCAWLPGSGTAKLICASKIGKK